MIFANFILYPIMFYQFSCNVEKDVPMCLCMCTLNWEASVAPILHIKLLNVFSCWCLRLVGFLCWTVAPATKSQKLQWNIICMVKMFQNVFVCALWDGKPVGLQNYTSSTGMVFFYWCLQLLCFLSCGIAPAAKSQ